MPELPEVETVRQILKTKVVGHKIKDVILYYPEIVEYPTSDEFKSKIINQTINDIKRRGKWLMFDLDDYYLLSHLRMEGKYNIKDKDDIVAKHEHVSFLLSNDRELRYQDTRKFGRMHLIEKGIVYDCFPLNELGLEPWDENLNEEYLKCKYRNKKLAIKTVLLDQSIIVGIGNIYADEILFLSNINPKKPASTLTKKERLSIIENTKKVLDKSIELGGTTIRTFTAAEGVHGRFQNELFVHGKENEKCSVCGSTIIKIKVNGRGTYYCPKCQK